MNRVNVLLMIGSMAGGGSERQTLLLLRHLDRRAFNVHLYVKRAEGSLMAQVPDDVCVHTATSFASHNRLYWPGRIAAQEANELRQILLQQEIDVVYDRTYHMSLIAGPACARLSGAGKRVPRISTIVSPPSRALPSVETRFVELKRRKLATAYSRSDEVIAVSQIAADDAARHYRLESKHISVIRNPVDVDALNEGCKHATSALDRDRERINMVCVGRMTSEKGHATLLNALQLLQDDWPTQTQPIHMWLVGDGPRRGELTDMACQFGLLASDESRSDVRHHLVSFVGHVNEPAASIAAADALVLPSHFEGLPNVVLEAMAVSTPVIATRAGGTTEIQHDDPVAFWAEAGDVASLAAAILKFVTHRDLANVHVNNALRALDQHHDVRQTTRRIESLLLRHLVAQHPSGVTGPAS